MVSRWLARWHEWRITRQRITLREWFEITVHTRSSVYLDREEIAEAVERHLRTGYRWPDPDGPRRTFAGWSRWYQGEAGRHRADRAP
jgi:hypothetical protein